MTKSPIKLLVVAAVLVAVIAIGGFIYSAKKTPVSQLSDGQIKTPHFVDSTPLHNETYAVQPVNVTANFNFDLAPGSQISVTSTNNQEWSDGEVLIEDNKTALKKDLKQSMTDGDYKVKYKTCWADRSCHDGQFMFKVDSTKKSEYQDVRGKKEVTVDMKDIKFKENKIIISPGVKVTWSNNDSVGHYVNTETHPEHTYFPGQNSQEISQGETYSVTLQTPGQYNYHCSAHVPEGMLGSIIVSN